MKNGVRTDEYFRNAEEGQNKAAEWVELARMGYNFTYFLNSLQREQTTHFLLLSSVGS
ncbi:MAG: hypothetical protein AAGG68_09895 [Bacteroidota bacterium]